MFKDCQEFARPSMSTLKFNTLMTIGPITNLRTGKIKHTVMNLYNVIHTLVLELMLEVELHAYILICKFLYRIANSLNSYFFAALQSLSGQILIKPLFCCSYNLIENICEHFSHKTGLYPRNPNEMISRMF